MKTTAMWMALALTTAALGALVALSLQSGSARAATEDATGSDVEFPVAGVTRTEMARLHLVYVNNDPAATAPPLNVTAQFVDRNGKPIKEQQLELQPNVIDSVDLGPAEFDSAPLVEPGPRLEFRTLLHVESLPCPPPTADGGVGTDGGLPAPSGSFTATLEVMTRRGDTVLLTVPATAIPIPSPCGPPPGTDAGAAAP